MIIHPSRWSGLQSFFKQNLPEDIYERLYDDVPYDIAIGWTKEKGYCIYNVNNEHNELLWKEY